ncbi:MAG: hypothetical protein FalmKO_07300 [Falsiruegeria mediterranea]
MQIGQFHGMPGSLRALHEPGGSGGAERGRVGVVKNGEYVHVILGLVSEGDCASSTYLESKGKMTHF